MKSWENHSAAEAVDAPTKPTITTMARIPALRILMALYPFSGYSEKAIGIRVGRTIALRGEGGGRDLVRRLAHDDVLELPRIVEVDVLGEQPLAAIVQRRPLGICSHQLA